MRVAGFERASTCKLGQIGGVAKEAQVGRQHVVNNVAPPDRVRCLRHWVELRTKRINLAGEWKSIAMHVRDGEHCPLLFYTKRDVCLRVWTGQQGVWDTCRNRDYHGASSMYQGRNAVVDAARQKQHLAHGLDGLQMRVPNYCVSPAASLVNLQCR